MKLYYQNDKLIMDASIRVIVKGILFIAVVIGTIIELFALAQDIRDNIFGIIFLCLILLFCCVAFYQSDPSLIKITFDENGISETRLMFIKGKQIAWGNLEDYYFVEFSPYRSEYPKHYRVVFTSKMPVEKACVICSPYFTNKQREKYAQMISDYCNRSTIV